MQKENSNVTDEELAKLEEELKSLEAESSSYKSPEATAKDSIYKFFREIINTKDSKKIGNMSKEELGKMTMATRPALELADYADAEGLDMVGNFIRSGAEIGLATSDSRDGFLAKLFVTQIRKEQKVEGSKKITKSWLGAKEVEEVPTDV